MGTSVEGRHADGSTVTRKVPVPVGGVDSSDVARELRLDSSGHVILAAGTNNIGDVDIASMPAADRTTDNVGAVDTTDAVMSDTTALTPKFEKANVAASQTDASIVAAVASKRIRVLAFRLHAGATATNVTFNSKPAGAGTAISELFALGANGGHSPGYCKVGHFQTVSGEGLTVTTGAGATTGIGVVYVEV